MSQPVFIDFHLFGIHSSYIFLTYQESKKKDLHLYMQHHYGVRYARMVPD
jgi:hypothetical protein